MPVLLVEPVFICIACGRRTKNDATCACGVVRTPSNTAEYDARHDDVFPVKPSSWDYFTKIAIHPGGARMDAKPVAAATQGGS